MTLPDACKRLFKIAVCQSSMLREFDVSPLQVWQRDGLTFMLASAIIYTPYQFAEARNDAGLLGAIADALRHAETNPLPTAVFKRRAEPIIDQLEKLGVL